jgi:DNA-binding beta-propeller fold protein YncE
VAGCPASGEEVQPPRDQIFFPTGLALDPSEEVLFVVNANSNLAYDSGSVVVADLDAIDTLTDAWLGGQLPAGDCVQDDRLAHIVQCQERDVVRPEASARIGNFATDIGVQELADGNLRLFVPVRGDPSITWIDYEAGQLGCGGSGSFPICDDDHRLSQYLGDLELPTLVSEPFGVYVDSGNGYAVVSHLSQAAVSLVDAPVDGTMPRLTDVIAGIFAASGQLRSAVDVAGRMPGMPEDLLYVTSSTESRIQMMYVHRAGDRARLAASEYFFLDQVFPSGNARGITFSDDGQRAYVVNRDPPMLQIIDTSIDVEGSPRNRLDVAIEVCRDAAQVVVADVGEGERVYVSCFPASQIWVVDPIGAQVEAVIDVGRGPSGLALSEQRQKLYVANFLEDTLSVIDLAPGSPTENLMVLRLGTPRQNEEEE